MWTSQTGDANGQSAARTAAVTGASVGLGRAVAVALGGLGWRVAIGARRSDRLDETAAEVRAAGGVAFAHALDVTDPASVARFFEAATSELGTIEVLVNNAGIASPGPLVSQTADEVRRTIETNLLGAVYCSQETMRGWQRADFADGDLVFISSETANCPWPQNLPYGASKAAVEHIARGLRLELEGTGARVSIIQLGPAQSEFGFGWEPERMKEALAAWNEARVWSHPAMMAAEDVARGVVLALTAPRSVEVHDLVMKPTRGPGDDTAG